MPSCMTRSPVYASRRTEKSDVTQPRTGLWLGNGEISFGLVEGGDVAEVRIQALDAVELVIDVRKLLLRLAPAVLQLQVLGANQLVFRDLTRRLEVVREGGSQRQHHP